MNSGTETYFVSLNAVLHIKQSAQTGLLSNETARPVHKHLS